MTRNEPLVSVVTPVYNGEPYLRECIESVRSQTYQNWEYIVLNNCSTDRTLDIAEHYRRQDGRIRVHSNARLLPIIANHNKAFSLISASSKYCKVVSADDWLYPECLARMVELAEANPSVGIVGSYQLSGGGERWYVRNHGLPYSATVVSGREICRAQLLGRLSVFGDPTSSLYRADLVRSTSAFYPNAAAEADVSAIFKHLEKTDFGFVHQVLSHERIHDVRQTTLSLERNAYVSAAIDDCLTYGLLYLTKDECETRVEQLVDAYYKYLATNALKFRNHAFWDYHIRRLHELGLPLDRVRLAKSIALKTLDLLLNPKGTAQLMAGRMRLRLPLQGKKSALGHWGLKERSRH
jgi:glycosyltransferase involved in cell wall biosynthesis